MLRMLTKQYPAERRVWQALADVAETDDERALVLEQLAALEGPPRHTVVLPETRAAELPAADTIALPPPAPQRPRRLPRATPVVAAPTDTTPLPQDDQEAVLPAARIRWPLYLITAIGFAIVLAVALARWVIWPPSTAQSPLPTAVATSAADITALPPVEATIPGSGALPTAVPIVTLEPAPGVATATPLESAAATAPPVTVVVTVLVPTELAATTVVPTPLVPTATSLPTLTPRPSLPGGQVVQQGDWNVTLLRPEHALLLNGSIGSLQPKGQFALALLSIGYSGDTAAQIPADLFTLQDNQGREYKPVPGASAAYLATFGRGQYGDVSLDEVIPANAGNVSVPVIFDVPLDARDLRLYVGDEPTGWEFAAPATP